MTDLSQIEERWRKRWEQEQIFEADANKKRKKFFLTFPYPYMNGYLHIGHFYTIMKVEAFARYKRMQGFNVLFPQGWHCTGSPIENAAQRIREKEKIQWENMRKMGFSDAEIEQFADPTYWATYFPLQAAQDYRTMGLSVDFRRSFITTELNPYYDLFIQWQFRKLKEKGLVEIGKHPVVWCLKDNSPVSDHSRVEGEGETPQEFMLLKFELPEGKYLVAATLRPETVFGLTNVWVNPNTLYVEAVVDGEPWIISNECAEKLRGQEHTVQINGTVLGKQLLGKTCLAPFINLPMMILPFASCDPTKGTGIVMSVPSDAPDDWMGLHDLQKSEQECKRYGLDWEKVKEIRPIPIIHSAELGDLAAITVCKQMKINSQHEHLKLQEAKKLVYKKGYYEGVMAKTTGKYAGMKVEKAKEQVKKELLKRSEGVLFYELTGKVVCRCLTPSIVKIVNNQWFLTYSKPEWKKLATKALQNVTLYPEKARQQFEYVIGWLNDWACTREYGLGTKLPWDRQWVIESLSDSTIYMAYYTVAHLITQIPIDQIDDAVFDYLFAAGKKPDIKGIEKLKEEFDYWYPVDFRNSGKDLIQNHLTFYLFNHTALFSEKHWPKGISVNGWVTVDGQKMSKSLGNVILVRELATTYSADASRFTILSGGEGLDDPNWDSEFARSIRSKLEQMYHFILEHHGKGRKEHVPIDDWMESKLHEVVKETTEHMERTMFRSALQKGFFDLQKSIRWYLKRTGDKPKEKLFREVLETQILLLAPFTPFVCEELWEKLGKKGFVAQANWPTYDSKKITQSFNVMEEIVRDTSEDIMQVLKLAKVAKPRKITLIVAEPWKYTLFKKLKELLEETRDIGKIQKALLQTDLKKHGEEIMKLVPRLVQGGKIPSMILDHMTEQDALQNAQVFFFEEFGADITVIQAQESTIPKAKQALPGKAAILVE